MTIKTVVKHKASEHETFYTTFGIEKIGFNLKALESVAKGYTDGNVTKELAHDPEFGDVVIKTRVWTNEEAANEWIALVLAEQPTQVSAEVIID